MAGSTANNAYSRLLVPVRDSTTIRNTVAYAIRAAESAATTANKDPTVHFVYLSRQRALDDDAADTISSADEFLERVSVWANEDANDIQSDSIVESAGSADVVTTDETTVTVETALLGTDQYLFSPADFAEITIDYAERHDLDRIIIDPEYQPGGGAPMLRSFETALTQADRPVEEAPVERRTSRSRITTPSTLTKGLTTFVICNVFYLLIAGSLTPFNLLTGSVTALAASIAFANITFTASPGIRKTGIRVLRIGLFIPYLLWEIAKANLAIAYIILHPSLPIDPQMQQFRAGVRGALPVMTLANSITLTPGTLTVDVDDDGLYIHTLTESARADLSAGGLERAVRFVFYGRAATQFPAPTERNSILSIPTDTESELSTDIIPESSSSQTPQEAD